MNTAKPKIFTESSSLSDITFIVEGKPLYVNRAVMAVTSPVFNIMLNGDFKENKAAKIPLPGKQYKDMLEFLLCVYPSTAKPVNVENLDVLLPLAEEYQVCSLKERCDAFMVNMLEKGDPSLNQMTHMLVLGDKYKLDKALQACLQTISRKQFDSIEKEEEFAHVRLETKYQLMSVMLHRYEKGIKDLRKQITSDDKLKDYGTCFHRSTDATGLCTVCRDEGLPGIIKRLDEFALNVK